jgi:hypothetical protein
MLSFEALTHGLRLYSLEDHSRFGGVTEISRELHGFFTLNFWSRRKLNLVMQGAFVVCLGSQGEQSQKELEGRIEEVDSGKSLRFHSGEELIEFLRNRQKDALTERERKDQ